METEIENPEVESDIGEDQPDTDEEQTTNDDDDKESESEEDDIRFEDEKEAEKADEQENYTFHDMRRRLHLAVKRNKELNYQLQQIQTEQQQSKRVHDPGPKPTLEGCDYDSDLYDKKIDEWYTQKNKLNQEQEQIEFQKRRQAEEWQKKIQAYQDNKSSLKVQDYDLAEATVEQLLNETQQGIIIDGVKNPAALIYALGKNPKRVEALAKINNPVSFAIELGRLESSLKVSKRKVKTKPEKTVSGTGPISGTSDAILDRYRREAEKTGNYTKLMDYKRKLRKRKAG